MISTNNALSHSKSKRDFLNSTFVPKEITMSCSGSCAFQQDIISSSIQNNSQNIIKILPALILLSTLVWFKFRCYASSMITIITNNNESKIFEIKLGER